MASTTWSDQIKKINTLPLQTTQPRLNLQAVSNPAQWSSDMARLVRQQTQPGFLTAEEPRFFESHEALQGEAAQTRKMKESVDELLHAQELWDCMDARCFDIVMGSVVMSEAQLDYVRRTFEPKQRGRALHDYVQNIIDPRSTSRKLKLEAELKNYKVTNSELSGEIDTSLQAFDMLWHKVHLDGMRPTSEEVLSFLNCFDKDHAHYDIVNGMRVQIAMSGLSETYDSFRIRFVEILAQNEVRDGVVRPRKQVALPGLQVDTPRAPLTTPGKPRPAAGALDNKCSKCSMGSCKNIGNASSCLLCDTPMYR